MRLPAPLASGRDADVFALDAHRVLRRYRDGSDATAEAAVMAYCRQRGFPAPRVHDAHGPDIIMERLDGLTVRTALRDNGITSDAAAARLADLHCRLHTLPSRISSDPSDRILHLDLHPDNVLLSPKGPVLIDWRNTTEGPPGLDVAMSALILAQATLDATTGTTPALLRSFLAEMGQQAESHLMRAADLRRADPNLTTTEIDQVDTAAALLRSRS